MALTPGAACPACEARAPEGGSPPGPDAGYVGQPGWDAAEAAQPPPGYPASPPVPGSALASDSQARDIATWTHLSALIAIVGIPSALGPLVVWLVKREAHPFVDAQGKEALNFNLSVLIYALGLGIFGFRSRWSPLASACSCSFRSSSSLRSPGWSR